MSLQNTTGIDYASLAYSTSSDFAAVSANSVGWTLKLRIKLSVGRVTMAQAVELSFTIPTWWLILYGDRESCYAR
jgi:hypothetical protein